MDYQGLLTSAMKGKARYVGIPIEGHAPIILDRKKLALSIKGVTVTSATVVDRWLIIQGTAGTNGTVHHCSKRPSLNRTVVLTAIRKERVKVVAAKMTPLDREIAKVQRELCKLSPMTRLRSLHPEYVRPGPDQYEREAELRWHKERKERKAVAWLAGLCMTGKITNTQLYGVLKAKGYDRLVKYSNLRSQDHQQGWDHYLKHLHTHTHSLGDTRSRWSGYKYGQPSPARPAHERYSWVLEQINKRIELESRLADLKGMKEPYSLDVAA